MGARKDGRMAMAEAAARQEVVGRSRQPGRALEALQQSLPAEVQRRVHAAAELVRRQRAQLREEPLKTMVDALDRLLGGGLPRGSVVELVGRGSCGRFTTLLTALKAITDSGDVAALIDQGAQLDPQAAAAIGVDLERLLWVRPQWLPDSLSAAERLVHTGFPLVAVDLGLPPVRGRATQAAWLRLARSCETHRAAVLVSSPYRLSGCAAAAVVLASRSRGLWSGSGRAAEPQLLNGLASCLTIARRRGERAGATGEIRFMLAEAQQTQPIRHSNGVQAWPRAVADNNTMEVQHAQAL